MQHSDRGSQYATHAYRRLPAKHGMLCSMSRKGNCWDNAPMESFFGSMKTELDDGTVFATRKEAKNAIFSFIEGFYNRQRHHSAIGYCSPHQIEQTAAAALAVTVSTFPGEGQGSTDCDRSLASALQYRPTPLGPGLSPARS